MLASQILNRTNNIFELVTVKAVKANDQRQTEQLMLKDTDDDEDTERKLRLKGQMIYMNNWRYVIFPVDVTRSLNGVFSSFSLSG